MADISGKTKAEVIEKFKALIRERESKRPKVKRPTHEKFFSCKVGRRYTNGHDGMC